MGSRLELQTTLEMLLGSRNVYFQPPESIKMKYPAIVYKRDDIGNVYASNDVYAQRFLYELTYIDEDPDNDMIIRLSKLPYCDFVRAYSFDGLNHYTFTLYY